MEKIVENLADVKNHEILLEFMFLLIHFIKAKNDAVLKNLPFLIQSFVKELEKSNLKIEFIY